MDVVDDLEIDTDGVPAALGLRGATDTTASEHLAIWYAAGDVSDQLIITLPSLPGPPTTTTNDGGTASDEASEEATYDRDASQASLNIFEATESVVLLYLSTPMRRERV